MRPTGQLHLGHLVGALGNWAQAAGPARLLLFRRRLARADQRLRRHQPADVVHATRTWPTGSAPVSIPRRARCSSSRSCRSTPSCTCCCRWSCRCPGSNVCRPTRSSRKISRTRICRRSGFWAIRCCRPPTWRSTTREFVPVGEDQVAHLELAREVVRRFNNFFGEALVEPQPLLTNVCPAARARRRQEDEQEPRQHHSPVRQRRRGEEEGDADVHRSEARARRHPGHRRGQSGLRLSRRVQSEPGRSRRPEDTLSRRQGRRRRGEDQARACAQRTSRADS